MSAPDFLEQGAKEMRQRAALRDTPEGERSMAKTVTAFNALFGTELTELQGWQFMVLLKMVRGSQGSFHKDDYVDQCSYSALAGECAEREQNPNPESTFTFDDAVKNASWYQQTKARTEHG